MVNPQAQVLLEGVEVAVVVEQDMVAGDDRCGNQSAMTTSLLLNLEVTTSANGLQVAIPGQLAEQLQRLCLPLGANEGAQGLLDDFPLRVQPAKLPGLLDEIVVQNDIGPRVSALGHAASICALCGCGSHGGSPCCAMCI